jgi:hypothetical protein
MLNEILSKLKQNPPMLLILLWVSLWIFSWATWWDSLPWVRLGISILIFITPGLLMSLFLVGDRLPLLGHISSGMALSVDIRVRAL